MALNLVSPGVQIREVDLTIGAITSTNDQVGSFSAPVAKGPVNQTILITNEAELLETFGKPTETDGQNEYWLSASNYLSYGGVLRVVRATGLTLNNANSDAQTSLQILNDEDYETNHTSDTAWEYAARTPGSWANNLKVCTIDGMADQIMSGIGTTSTSVTTSTNVATKTGDVGITTNLITGIACSWFDSIPSLHITGQVNSYEKQGAQKGTKNTRQVGFQETDIVSITKPITKFLFLSIILIFLKLFIIFFT